MRNFLFSFIIAITSTLSVNADEIQRYTVKVGEVIKLQIPSTGRTLLNRATSKRGDWSVNALYLEVVSYSWDHCYVKAKKVTNAISVQQTVTFNMNGHYGDKYYAAHSIKIVPNGPTSISLRQNEVELETGERHTLQATITGSSGTYRWTSSDNDIVSVMGDGLQGHITAHSAGTAYITVSTGTYSATAKITITEWDTTSIEEIADEEEEPTISIGGDCITLGCETDITILDMSGKIIFHGITDHIEGLEKGIYILLLEGKSHKISV